MASKILVIDAHPDPDPKRLDHALADVYAQGAREAGAEVRLLRLCDTPIEMLRSAEAFGTAPTQSAIVSAREDIVWAEHLVFVFPLWLGDMPALLKAFFEQISRASFAIGLSGNGFPKPMLKGRSARLIVTMGMPGFAYRLLFGAHAMRGMSASILEISGIRPVRHTYFGGIGARDAAERALSQTRDLGRRKG